MPRRRYGTECVLTSRFERVSIIRRDCGEHADLSPFRTVSGVLHSRGRDREPSHIPDIDELIPVPRSVHALVEERFSALVAHHESEFLGGRLGEVTRHNADWRRGVAPAGEVGDRGVGLLVNSGYVRI